MNFWAFLNMYIFFELMSVTAYIVFIGEKYGYQNIKIIIQKLLDRY